MNRISPASRHDIRSLTIEREHDLKYPSETSTWIQEELGRLSQMLSGLVNLRNLRLVFSEPSWCPHRGGTPVSEDFLLQPFKPLASKEGLRFSADFCW